MVIIKYYEWMILNPSLRGVVYRKYDDATFNKNCKRADDEEGRPKKDQGKEIPREEALRLIRENNLKIVHKNKYGTIWR